MPPTTQTDRPKEVSRWLRFLTGPLGLAALVTLANAAKPVLVDDTAYLTYARHIAGHPLDPYGFEVFWYTWPEPAMDVLCPPVLPYWLAAGVRLFGDHPPLLKLWLFPFVWLLAWSLWELLRRFARGTERVSLPLLMLSPAVLPTVNLMLDIPAVALGLAAVVLLIRGVEGDRRFLLAAGLVAALAMQAKYTALLVPPLFAWYGWTHGRLRPALLAAGVAGAGFAAWELLLVAGYGQSHFLLQLAYQKSAGGGLLHEKLSLVPALAGHLGCLAVGVGLYAGRAVGVAHRRLLLAAVLWAVGVGLICVLPYQATVIVHGKEPGHDKLTLAAVVWRTAGTAVLLGALLSAAMLLVSIGRGIRKSHRADALFVVGWVLLELAGYFALTPFPAARRVIGLTLALGLLAARAVSRVSRARPERRPPRWVLPFGVAAGMLVAAIDTLDALPEKNLAEQAARTVEEQRPRGTVWYVGHWGFQYYCERGGMRPVVPGRTRLEPGDYLVLPVYPDEVGFWRPYAGLIPVRPPEGGAELVAAFEWDDRLSAQTIPNFYGGVDPLVGRDHPRLRVAVYRVLKPWAVSG